MTNAESTTDRALLVIRTGKKSHVVEPARGVVTIGRDPQAVVQIDDPRISRAHLRAEFADGRWQIADISMNGMYVDGLRKSVVTVTDGLTVHLGDPVEGPSVGFEVVAPLDAPTPVPEDQAEDTTTVLDPGVARAGAAAAARRRELDISQRSLAADGIINAGALIAFETGRSWPRERTRAKLEEVLRWPPGTIARIRQGEPAARDEDTEVLPAGDDEVPLIAQAVVAAVHTLGAAIDSLPPVDHPDFTPRLTAILSDLRQLEAVAARATRISRVTPALIKALSTVRQRMDELTMLGATAPGATLGQRLYAARRRANLTVRETADAAGVSEDVIVRAEAEQAVPATAVQAIESLLSQIDWR
jgi:pSer/pThr/pTyr-binding forkhead associated (FHA) protein/DNA-binding XRE family transcriptional regulator